MTKLEIIRRLTRMADTQTGEETTPVDSGEYYRLLSDLRAETRAGQEGGARLDAKKCE